MSNFQMGSHMFLNTRNWKQDTLLLYCIGKCTRVQIICLFRSWEYNPKTIDTQTYSVQRLF